MTDPLNYKARLNARGLDNTGVTQDIAKAMGNALGRHTVLIVDVKHARLITDDDGTRQVVLKVDTVEPVPAAHEDTVREFMRALYRTRPEVEGQAVLRGVDGDEMSPADAAAAMTAATEDMGTGATDGEWDGSTDGPLTSSDEAGCPFPGCFQPAEHDGDHADAFGAALPDEPENVVKFSGR